MTDVPLIHGRECGSCTACCSALTIDHPEIQKPARVLCKNCNGAGCNIYDERPAPCRIFNCAWRVWPAFDPLARPDRTGVLPLIAVASRDPQNSQPEITLLLYEGDRLNAVRAAWLVAFVQQATLSGVGLYLGLAAPPAHLPLRASLKITGMMAAAQTSVEAVGKVLEQALEFLESQPFRPYALQFTGNAVG